MNNDDLVGTILNGSIFEEHKSPEYERVVETMRGVDRKDFLGTEPVTLVGVHSLILQNMRGALQRLKEPKIGFNFQMDDFFAGLIPNIDNSREVADLIESAGSVANSARPYFVEAEHLAYNDMPLPIGHQQTCSQPSLVAFMAYQIELQDGLRVLEIGSGCGYHAAIVSHLIEDSGYLVTVEKIPQLAELAQGNLEAHFGKDDLEKRIKIIPDEDGSIGAEEYAPFDRIYLTAGVDLKSFNPSVLGKQLNPKWGILLFPQQEGYLIKQVYKDGIIESSEPVLSGIGFVPLVGENT
tara:strand:- start:60965 stop:61849 length:885 start_codon:yes stop_codon:yes gene_type:complete